MFYKKNKSKDLQEELFRSPGPEYRGAPFWAWNGRLEDETLREQIEVMKRMGMGGFFMHVRTGMDSPYLDEEFMDHVRTCVEKAKQEGMLAWLYDEDRWPSGSAGGKVTRNHPEFAAKSLLITTRPYADGKACGKGAGYELEPGGGEEGRGGGEERREGGEEGRGGGEERREDGEEGREDGEEGREGRGWSRESGQAGLGLEGKSEPGRGRGGVRQENGKLLAVFDVELNGDGTLKDYRRLDCRNSGAEDRPENVRYGGAEDRPENIRNSGAEDRPENIRYGGAEDRPESGRDEARGRKWYVYLEHACADPWFNDAAYVDTLSYEAVAAFLRSTHEAYFQSIGQEFGGAVPAIFTDEPQFNAKTTLDFAQEEKDVFLPWTTDLEEDFRRVYGYELLPCLPELLWELPEGGVSVHRYRYHDYVADRFADAYCNQIGEWCREHGIRFTGHVLGEGTLEEQTQALGECMRCYKSFEIPGMDNLCDRREYTTAKQVQSMVRQTGAEAMLSELYGVTGWDYDFRGYKLQGDWQAALGVTVRVPHLFWMTMKGEAKRDFPASIGCQSPWYEEFPMLEDYFARVNTAMTRGKAAARIGVIHPIESYWLHWGPAEQTAAARARLEEQFQTLAENLLFQQLDFDYISERELPGLCPQGGNPLRVGEMAYDVIIVPGCETLRGTTVDRLRTFREQGGELLFIGEAPRYVDAKESGEAGALYQKSVKVQWSGDAVAEALRPYRFLEIRREDGSREDSLLCQLRVDKGCLWLFLANGRKPECPDVDEGRILRFTLEGEFRVIRYEALDGAIIPLPVNHEHGRTVWSLRWFIHDSLMLRLEKTVKNGEEPGSCAAEQPVRIGSGSAVAEQPVRTGSGSAVAEHPVRAGGGSEAAAWTLPGTAVGARQPEPASPCVRFGRVRAKLREPNMLLLDMAEYSVDGGPWQPEEELLRIDNLARAGCGLPPRRREVTQPYLLKEEKPEHSISLRMEIESGLELTGCRLGLEDAADTVVYWNGLRVPSRADGWYVDRSIETIGLPPVKKGKNLLELTVPLGRRTNLEYFYLLGSFGVDVAGTEKRLIPLPRTLGFGDIVRQGLPFYTGCLDYEFEMEARENPELAVPRYRGALVKVLVDGKDRGNIAFSPYRLKLSDVAPGRHTVTLRLYVTRQNGFGQLHHTPGVWFYQSPNSWRSTGPLWCYEYQLREAGILKSPELYRADFV